MTIDELLKDIHAIQDHLKKFEEKYKLISSDFYKLYKANKLELSRDFIKWLGFYEIMLDRESEYKKLLKEQISEYDFINSDQRLSDLVAELKSVLSEVSESNFKFEKEHRDLFLENANLFAPFIPSMTT